MLAELERAEDQRSAKGVSEGALTSHDVSQRRRAVRALSRIADPVSEVALLRALADEDEEAVAWAAYGLGWTCKGHEEPHVRAMAARAASLGAANEEGASPRVDARTALARAAGRCGGALAESMLAGWVRSRGEWAEPAAYALGDLAGRQGELDDDAASALVDAATQGLMGSPLDAALYPFSRSSHLSEALGVKVAAAAHAALARPGEARAFAIRTLGKLAAAGADDLVRVATSGDFSSAERAEAARALGQIGEAGRTGASLALSRLTPDKDPFAIAALGGDSFSVLDALIGAVSGDAPKSAEPALYALANLKAPGEVPAPLGRRIAVLRCDAASALARGAYDADVLRQCDDPTSEASERARLASLLRRPLTVERRAAWRSFATSAHVTVREAALEAISQHAELADAAHAPLSDALRSLEPGLVATAAEVLEAHPERALVLAASERRAALDPGAPPPTANPNREVDPAIAAALEAALAHPFRPDQIETRVALIGAAVALHLPSAHGAATRACADANTTVREHAAKALRALGDSASTCPGGDLGDAGATTPVPEGAPDPRVLGPTTVTLSTDAGDLSIVFDPELAPVAVSRFVALARSGFYDGTVVHRVVPGFVAQFGDPEGDGYGGSGRLLRCETSPVPFRRLDVGVALAGRDTGSSQLFVTLGRFPHLDGEYARVGHAEGDWDAVVRGDVIHSVKVAP